MGGNIYHGRHGGPPNRAMSAMVAGWQHGTPLRNFARAARRAAAGHDDGGAMIMMMS